MILSDSMTVRRCPQCGTATDDVYGFCIKCGYEFPKLEAGENACPLCGYPNPDEADFCVKCGTPLLFKSQFEGSHTALNPIVIKKEITGDAEAYNKRANKWIVIFGYVFSVLGGLLGLIIGIYLSTRKNPIDRRHGHIQLAIFAFYILLIAIMFATGNLNTDSILANYTQLMSGNLTSL